MYLGYALSPAPVGGAKCTLVSEFDVIDVPHHDFANFTGGPEPYVVVKW